jgi:hypothetical protein
VDKFCCVCTDVPHTILRCTRCMSTVCMKQPGDDGPGCLRYNLGAEQDSFRILCHHCCRTLKKDFKVRFDYLLFHGYADKTPHTQYVFYQTFISKRYIGAKTLNATLIVNVQWFRQPDYIPAHAIYSNLMGFFSGWSDMVQVLPVNPCRNTDVRNTPLSSFTFKQYGWGKRVLLP